VKAVCIIGRTDHLNQCIIA